MSSVTPASVLAIDRSRRAEAVRGRLIRRPCPLREVAHRLCGTRTVVREQPIVQQQPVVERERVVVMTPPAAQAETVPPAPAASGYTWVPGRYEWRDGRWVWLSGTWVSGTVRPVPAPNEEATPPAPFAGARWVPGYWRFAGNDWVWVRGHWL